MQGVGQLIGQNVKRLRVARGWSQERLARALSHQGVTLGRSGIAWLETGRRKDPTLTETLALASCLGTSVAKLLANDEIRVHFGEREVEGEDLVRMAAGRKPHSRSRIEPLQGRDPEWVEHLMGQSDLDPIAQSNLVQDAEFNTSHFVGDAERTIARRLQIDPDEVVVLSKDLWGRSLTEERDALAADFTGKPTGRAMHKAHISRRLQKELLEERYRRSTRWVKHGQPKHGEAHESE
jgi:transcriptional regulator with XRE-family HTH domain